MLANEKAEHYPVFYKVIGGYEIFYLQIDKKIGQEELLAAGALMKKGIGRLETLHQQQECRTACLVYEASFESWLRNKQQERCWQNFWNLPVYGEYREPHNLMLLLQQVPKYLWPRQLIILGEAPGMEVWLVQLARYMRGITVYAGSKPKAFEQLREKLQQEYGLLLGWEERLHPQSREPAMVIDYCGREKVFAWGIPAGSIWIDMNSMEIRRHALEDRDTGIQYYSLKCFWKEEMQQTLDTANKILYNTGVN